MNPEPLSFLSSLVGGRAKPRRPFTNRFSSPVPSWGNVPEADSKAVPMAPLRRLRFCFFGDGPHSEIREGDLFNIRRNSNALRMAERVRWLSMKHTWWQTSGVSILLS
ncbi:hypothetical protein Bca52824_066167 [Brassica carinata]|uniref:Uncharacterized protein n=1 Tax=Brassica carinata TaxID=52824 RepID=A0A8X7QK42_BRACI|nr:hypothetical protein Bca52824_066167 [Brassica carinata]